MKKVLIPVIIILLFILAIYKFGADRLFTPGAVRKVRKKSIENLKKNVDEAEILFKKQLNSADKVGRTYAKLGKEYIENKNWTPGIDSLKKAIEYGSSGARVHHLLGMAYANRAKNLSSESDINSSEKHYKRSLEINDKLTDSKYGLALLYFYLKDQKEDAVSIMKSITIDDKSYYRARFALGRLYYELKEPAKSLSAYEDLYSDLNNEKLSPQIKEYRKKCKVIISRLMMEMSGKK